VAISIVRNEDEDLIIWATKTHVDAIKQMVHRAVNLWPDAPPEIKELADLITVGHIQQNYHVQDTSKKKVT